MCLKRLLMRATCEHLTSSCKACHINASVQSQLAFLSLMCSSSGLFVVLSSDSSSDRSSCSSRNTLSKSVPTACTSTVCCCRCCCCCCCRRFCCCTTARCCYAFLPSSAVTSVAAVSVAEVALRRSRLLLLLPLSISSRGASPTAVSL
jgi:hypothetical protein